MIETNNGDCRRYLDIRNLLIGFVDLYKEYTHINIYLMKQGSMFDVPNGFTYIPTEEFLVLSLDLKGDY